jgi:hypothetical protein
MPGSIWHTWELGTHGTHGRGAFLASIRSNIAILQQLGVLGIVASSDSAKPLISRNIAKIAKIARTRDGTRNARRSRRGIDSWSFFVHFVDFVSISFPLGVLVSGGLGNVDSGRVPVPMSRSRPPLSPAVLIHRASPFVPHAGNLARMARMARMGALLSKTIQNPCIFPCVPRCLACQVVVCLGSRGTHGGIDQPPGIRPAKSSGSLRCSPESLRRSQDSSPLTRTTLLHAGFSLLLPERDLVHLFIVIYFRSLG